MVNRFSDRDNQPKSQLNGDAPKPTPGAPPRANNEGRRKTRCFRCYEPPRGALLTPEAVASKLHLTTEQVLALIKQGGLSCYVIGAKHVRFSNAHIHDYLRSVRHCNCPPAK